MCQKICHMVPQMTFLFKTQCPSSNQPTQCHEARRGKCRMGGTGFWTGMSFVAPFRTWGIHGRVVMQTLVLYQLDCTALRRRFFQQLLYICFLKTWFLKRVVKTQYGNTFNIWICRLPCDHVMPIGSDGFTQCWYEITRHHVGLANTTWIFQISY